MAIQKIVQLGNPTLREICQPVLFPVDKSIFALAEDLKDTLANARSVTGYGRGIAAPQIGVLKRVVYLNIPGSGSILMLNPEIVERSSEKVLVWDACLSFLTIFMQVPRHKRITVKYSDLDGKSHTLPAGPEHDLAELLQHEIDHLNGILTIDRVEDLRSIVSKEEFELRYRGESPYAQG